MSARNKAFLIHLSCSIAVAVGLAWLVFEIWYPAPLDQAIGVRRIFLISLAVHVTLGPFITLIIYKPNKKGLLFDLWAVIFLQFIALAFGMNKLAAGRPAWLVFTVDRFEVVRAYEVTTTDPEGVRPEFRTAPLDGPHWIAAISPSDESTQQRILLESLVGGPDLQHHAEHYQPINYHLDMVKARMRKLHELKGFNQPDLVDNRLAPFTNATGWVPLVSNDQSMVVILDVTGSVQGIAELNPW